MVTFLNARAVETDFNTNRVYTEKALVPTEDLVKLRRELDELLKDGTKVNALDAPVHTVRDVMELLKRFYRGGGGGGGGGGGAGEGVAPTDNAFLVGNGAAFVGEIGATARTSIGLGTTDAVSFSTVNASGVITCGDPAAAVTQLTVRGGASGGTLLTLARTVGATSTFTFALSANGLSITDSTAAQPVAGWFGNTSTNELYLGNKASGVPRDRPAMLSSTTQAAAAGADLPGNDLNLQAAGGTGAGVPGDVVIKTATALASGTAVQTAIERVVVLGGSGNMGVGTSVPTRKVDVVGDIGATTGIKVTGATGTVGYTTGAGGAVTQATSKSTGVTLDTPSGTVTTTADSLAGLGSVTFTVTNSRIAATDCVCISLRAAGATAGAYDLTGHSVAAGSFAITIRNLGATGLAEALQINFAIVAGASS